MLATVKCGSVRERAHKGDEDSSGCTDTAEALGMRLKRPGRVDKNATVSEEES